MRNIIKKMIGTAMVLVPIFSVYSGEYSGVIVISNGSVVGATGDAVASATYVDSDGDCVKTVYGTNLAEGYNYPSYPYQEPDLNSNELADRLTEESKSGIAGLQIVNGELLRVAGSEWGVGGSVTEGKSGALGWVVSFLSAEDKAVDIGYRISKLPGEDAYLLLADVVVSEGRLTGNSATYQGGTLSGSTRVNEVDRYPGIQLGKIDVDQMTYEQYLADPSLNPSSSNVSTSVITKNEGDGFFTKTDVTDLSKATTVDVALHDGKESLGFVPCDNEHEDLWDLIDATTSPNTGGSGGSGGSGDSGDPGDGGSYYAGYDDGYIIDGYLPGDEFNNYDPDPCPTCEGTMGELEVVEYYA